MGLAASTGRNNYELVDKLKESDLIHNDDVERVLRLVDRGRFFPADARHMAYRDVAWKSEQGDPGRLHISAPCIYANVLDHLHVAKGNSFLNIGSGTGYLSTVVGFLLGSSGVNHGIEIHENIVNYARERVSEWIHAAETQCFDWAVPEFTCGNGLLLSHEHAGKYDRVYCGAAVPMNRRNTLMDLLQVNGILIMPYQDKLEQVRRVSDDTFHVKMITSVSFSDFIMPSEEEIRNERWSRAPSFSIATLQHISAQTIRRCIRTAMMPSYKIRIRKYNISTTTNEVSADSEQEPSFVIHRGSDGAIEREVHMYGEEMANVRRRPVLPIYPTPIVIEMQELMRRNRQYIAERRRLPNGTAQVIRGMHALGFEMEDSDLEEYPDDEQLDETSERSEQNESNRTGIRAEVGCHSDQQAQQERNDNNAQMGAVSTTLGKRSRNERETENTKAKRHNGEVQKRDSIEMNEDTPKNNNQKTSKQKNVIFEENAQNETDNGESNGNNDQNQGMTEETLSIDKNNPTDHDDNSRNNNSEPEVTTNIDNNNVVIGPSAKNANYGDAPNVTIDSVSTIRDAQRSSTHHSILESDGDEEREPMNAGNGDVSAVLLHRESMPHSVVDCSEERMSVDTSNNDAEEDDLRDEEERFQMEDIKRFSAEFERRIEKLPLSKALIEYIKYLP